MNRSTRTHPGFTLVEMVVSLAILSIVMSALMSTMLLATQTIPAADDPGLAAPDVNAAMERILADAAFARSVEVRSQGLILAVNDRTGDGNPDIIRYTLTDAASPPTTLYTSINDGNHRVLLSGVVAFGASVTMFETTDNLLTVQIATSRGTVYRSSVELATRPQPSP